MSSRFPGSLDNLIVAGIAGDSDVKAAVDTIQAKIQRILAAQRTVSPGAGETVTPDMSQGWTLRINMPAADITLADPVRPQPGDFLILVIVEHPVGGGLVNWGPSYRKNVTLSQTGNSIDTVLFRYADAELLWDQIGTPALDIR